MYRIILWLAITIYCANSSCAKELFVVIAAPASLLEACRKVAESSDLSRQLSLKLEQLDNQLLACYTAAPTCPDLQSITRDRVAYENRMKLERGKLSLFRGLNTTINIDLFPPEVILLFGPSITDQVASGQLMEVSIAGQESRYSKELRIEEGSHYDLMNGISLTTRKIRDFDQYAKGLDTIFGGRHSRPSDPVLAKMVAEMGKVYDGRQISLEADMKQVCDLTDNERGEVIRITASDLSTHLSGVKFNNMKIVFVVTLRDRASQYPQFDWFSSIQQILEALFNVLPLTEADVKAQMPAPTEDDVKEKRICSDQDMDNIFKDIQSMRLLVRQKTLLGNSETVYEKATKRFVGGNSPYSMWRPFLRFSFGENGLIFGLDEKRNMRLIGYSRFEFDHVCYKPPA
jgi:hypothetical protein